MKTNFIRWKI